MVKPKVLIVIDVQGWAWDIKAKNIKYWLSKFYDIDIVYTFRNTELKINKSEYDLYFTFSAPMVTAVKTKQNLSRCITGITAHRPSKFIKPFVDMVSHHHANSVMLCNVLEKLGKNPFYTPNGVDTNMFHPIKPQYYKRSNLIIGHVGKKSKIKNQVDFIEPIIKATDVLYLPHYNSFSNKIPHEKMVFKYQEFDIFIAASSEDGTPNGMLEAMACGRPVIINRIGNAPELIKDGYNGFLVGKSGGEYIEKIKWCKNNPWKVIEMGKNARLSILQGWTWELMSRNYLYMFDTVLGIKRDNYLYENPSLYHRN